MSRFGPPLAIMAVIWILSAQPDLRSGLDADWDLVLRKLAHMVVFGTLFLTLWRALRWRGARALPAGVLTVLYAVSDELHQTTVAGRHGSPVDVLIDAVGVGLAYALVTNLRRRRRARTPRPPRAARPGPPGTARPRP